MKIPQDLKWKTTGRSLGQGGQAHVYEVYDESDPSRKKFALKALSKNKPREAYERFYREISAIKSLSNPYIIDIEDHSKPHDEFHYYVMEFIENALSLKRLINQNENPYFHNGLKTLKLLSQLLDAIKECEQNDPKVVHRDLNPANILVTPNKDIKIIDFGLCQIEGNSPLTLIDEGVGTQNYMAPECESGSESEIGIHSDIYSMGKIVWSAITNQMAFAREKPAFTNRSIKNIFPNNPEHWHLQHIMSFTVRHNPSDRSTVDQLIYWVKRVRQLIISKYPPLELITEQCPICGWGKLDRFEQSHAVFGNPNPRGIYALQCDYCGYCFAINPRFRTQKEKVNHIKQLQEKFLRLHCLSRPYFIDLRRHETFQFFLIRFLSLPAAPRIL